VPGAARARDHGLADKSLTDRLQALPDFSKIVFHALGDGGVRQAGPGVTREMTS